MLEAEGQADSRPATGSYVGVDRPSLAYSSTNPFDPLQSSPIGRKRTLFRQLFGS